MTRFRLILLPAAALVLTACGQGDPRTARRRPDDAPPPARRSLEKVRIVFENGCVVARETDASAAADRPRATARFHLGGVDCGSCAPTLAVELGQIAGIREARISQTVPEATVEYDPGKLTAPQVLGAIARTGLHPKPVP